jgi:hypothetical protein
MSDVDSFIKKFSGMTEEYRFYNDTEILRYDPKGHVYFLLTGESTLTKLDGVTTVCHIVDKSHVLIPWACKMMGLKLNSLIGTQPFGTISISQEELEAAIMSAKTAHKDELEKAGDIGSDAHAWIERYIKAVLSEDPGQVELVTLDMPSDERAKSCCIAALDWMKQHNVRWIGTERKVYSRQFKYAGTLDGLCTADSCNDPVCCPEKFKDKLTLADWKTSNYLYVEYILQTAAYKQAYEEELGTKVTDIWVIRLGKEDAAFDAWHVDLVLAAHGWNAFRKALDLSRAMQTLDDAVSLMKDTRRQARRAEKELAAKVNQAIKCKNANKYKGKRKPTCNGGSPCEFCLNKYQEEQGKKEKALQELKDSKVKAKVTIIDENTLKSLQNLLDN